MTVRIDRWAIDTRWRPWRFVCGSHDAAPEFSANIGKWQLKGADLVKFGGAGEILEFEVKSLLEAGRGRATLIVAVLMALPASRACADGGLVARIGAPCRGLFGQFSYRGTLP